MDNKTNNFNLAYGSILIALLIIFQYVTSFFSNHFLTGMCVNLILALTVFKTDLKTIFFVALISPSLAFCLGIGPKIPLFIPFLIVSNCIFMYLIWFALQYSKKKNKYSFIFIIFGICLGAIFKSLFIFISSAYILPLFLILNNMQRMIFGSAFSFVACISAILGGILAYWIDNFRLRK